MATPKKAAKGVAGKARPTPDDFPKIFALMSGDEAMSLSKACARLGLDQPSASHIIAADPVIRAQYEAARALRGDHYGERVADLAADVLDKAKGLDPAAARVAMDALKWTAARMHPKAWGDKTTVEHTDPDGKNPFKSFMDTIAADGRPKPGGAA